MNASPHAVAAFVVRELVERDLAAYKALRDDALARHDDAFTSDAATEALRIANQNSGRTLFDWRFISVDGKPVRAGNGMLVTPDTAIDQSPDFSTLIVCRAMRQSPPSRRNACR